MIQGSDGNFYGTTSVGGNAGAGTVFKLTPAGDLTTLYTFCSVANCGDGEFPYAGLAKGQTVTSMEQLPDRSPLPAGRFSRSLRAGC